MAEDQNLGEGPHDAPDGKSPCSCGAWHEKEESRDIGVTIRDMRNAVAAIDVCVNDTEADKDIAVKCAQKILAHANSDGIPEWPEDILPTEVVSEAIKIVGIWGDDTMHPIPTVSDSDGNQASKDGDKASPSIDITDGLTKEEVRDASALKDLPKNINELSDAFLFGWMFRMDNPDKTRYDASKAGLIEKPENEWIDGWREADRHDKETRVS